MPKIQAMFSYFFFTSPSPVQFFPNKNPDDKTL